MELRTDEQGRIAFGIVAGTRLGGPAARLADLKDFYRTVANLGVEHVIHLGGLFDYQYLDDEQMVVRSYPQVAGVTTLYAWSLYPHVRIEPAMRAAARHDWRDLSDSVELVRANPGMRVPVDLRYVPRPKTLPVVDANHPVVVLIGGNPHTTLARHEIGKSAIVDVGAFSKRGKNPYGGGLFEARIGHQGIIPGTLRTSFFDFGPNGRLGSD
jgi:hypothetical protein